MTTPILKAKMRMPVSAGGPTAPGIAIGISVARGNPTDVMIARNGMNAAAAPVPLGRDGTRVRRANIVPRFLPSRWR